MWKSYLLLSVAALLPVITTIIFFYLGKIKLFKNMISKVWSGLTFNKYEINNFKLMMEISNE